MFSRLKGAFTHKANVPQMSAAYSAMNNNHVEPDVQNWNMQGQPRSFKNKAFGLFGNAKRKAGNIARTMKREASEFPGTFRNKVSGIKNKMPWFSRKRNNSVNVGMNAEHNVGINAAPRTFRNKAVGFFGKAKNKASNLSRTLRNKGSVGYSAIKARAPGAINALGRGIKKITPSKNTIMQIGPDIVKSVFGRGGRRHKTHRRRTVKRRPTKRRIGRKH